MAGIYKGTTIDRATVVQEARIVLPREDSAPIGTHRRVQIIVPTEPKLYVGVDVDLEKLGLNRTYKLPELAPGALIAFRLLPNQFLVAASHAGMCFPSIIVEYLRDDDA